MGTLTIFSILQTEKQRLREIKPLAQVTASDGRAKSSRARPDMLRHTQGGTAYLPTSLPCPMLQHRPAWSLPKLQILPCFQDQLQLLPPGKLPLPPPPTHTPQILKIRPVLKISKGDTQFSHPAYRDWTPRGFPSSGLGKPGPELRHIHSTSSSPHAYYTLAVCRALEGSERGGAERSRRH